jgi:4'-phosphopantetheinyl transferase
MGLSIPLEQFSFELDQAPPIRIGFSPLLPDAASDWQFQMIEPGNRHLIAVSLRRGRGPDVRITVTETIPGCDAT